MACAVSKLQQRGAAQVEPQINEQGLKIDRPLLCSAIVRDRIRVAFSSSAGSTIRTEPSGARLSAIWVTISALDSMVASESSFSTLEKITRSIFLGSFELSMVRMSVFIGGLTDTLPPLGTMASRKKVKASICSSERSMDQTVACASSRPVSYTHLRAHETDS